MLHALSSYPCYTPLALLDALAPRATLDTLAPLPLPFLSPSSPLPLPFISPSSPSQTTVFPFILRGVRLLGVDSTLPWNLAGYPQARSRPDLLCSSTISLDLHRPAVAPLATISP